MIGLAAALSAGLVTAYDLPEARDAAAPGKTYYDRVLPSDPIEAPKATTVALVVPEHHGLGEAGRQGRSAPRCGSELREPDLAEHLSGVPRVGERHTGPEARPHDHDREARRREQLDTRARAGSKPRDPLSQPAGPVSGPSSAASGRRNRPFRSNKPMNRGTVMRRLATAAFVATAALASSAGSANAFFHLLFQPQEQQQQYYRNEPSPHVQISPIPREIVSFSGYSAGHDRDLDRRAPALLRARQRQRGPLRRRGRPPGVRVGRDEDHHAQGRVAGLDASAPDAEAPAGPPAPHEGRHRQPARRPRDVSRRLAVPHPRLERAGHDRPSGVLGLHPDDECGRGRPLQPRRVGTRVVVLR